MFRLVNKYGNVIKETESVRKRDQLIDKGYFLIREIPAQLEAQNKTTSAKRGKKNAKTEN